MRGIFCRTNARTNEEYREVLKRRNVYMALVVIAGIILAITAYAVSEKGASALPEYILGVYCGAGSGMAAAGLVFMIRNLCLMRNEEKLKKSRLENTDERMLEICSKAVNAAVLITLLTAVLAGLIAGIFYPILIKALIFVLYLFIFSYAAAYLVYKKKL